MRKEQRNAPPSSSSKHGGIPDTANTLNRSRVGLPKMQPPQK